jgi:hypothetical protein
MPKVTIRKRISFPSFGAAKWRKSDHETPLRLRLTQASALIYLDEDTLTKRGLIVFPGGRIELVYDPAPPDLVEGLASKGPKSTVTAERIYAAYVEAYTKFESLLYVAGRVRYLMRMGPESMTAFYETGLHSRETVEWKIDDKSFQHFQPRLRKSRGMNPLFTSSQLVTPFRWQDMQRCANNAAFPEGELLELYRIRGKAGWHDLQQTVAIEASIISETLLRAYGLKALKESGFSNNKLKRMRDELTFNNLLNIVLPLSLTKMELKKVQKAIDAVDRLRGVRNDLVHGNITAKEVDHNQVEAGIDGAIQLVRFLQVKLA